VEPQAPAEKGSADAGAIVFSLAAAGHVLDCRAGVYNPRMQAALAAEEAGLRCAAGGDELVLQVHATTDGPALSLATIRQGDDGVELTWVGSDAVSACASTSSYVALRDSACGKNSMALEGMSIRRTWP